MAEANERSKEMARSNSCVFPRDLLQRFISNSVEGEDDDEEEDDDEIELNLGLSLGGRFGVDKSNKLVRSSSVVVTMPLFREDHRHQAAAMITTKVSTETVAGATRGTGLMRTTSLPAESEEEWRKRKEMQTLRRMAAKRRRSEKLRTGVGGGNSNNPEEAATATASRRRGRPSSGLPRWSATANKSGLFRQHSAGLDSLQVSVESLGGGRAAGSSSSVSELETKASSDEARSLPSTTQQQQETTTKPTNRLRRLSSVDMNMKMEPQGKGKSEMPCVFTKGDGPNGKRVDGILYRYGSGEEVRIMCVCHGDFLSPADFVKHAGGPHVDHPLRHIVVNTSSPSNLL
ncbi:Ethylene-responsive binding factor-associated repression [Arabidopsis suecica]|uniref:Ninja-family protein n=1 Tax=Arabidopsis suecica TaxID=45249 RepID=A0A8T2HKI4_ARASU|nr:Ethylene-responsive binding factor-associated repression [Arabidopsis suecica]